MRKTKLYFGSRRTHTLKVLGFLVHQAKCAHERDIYNAAKDALGDTPFRVIMGNGHEPDDFAIEVKAFPLAPEGEGYAWIRGDDPAFMAKLLMHSTHDLDELAPLHLLEQV